MTWFGYSLCPHHEVLEFCIFREEENIENQFTYSGLGTTLCDAESMFVLALEAGGEV